MLHHKKVLISVITMPTWWCIVALLQLPTFDVILLFIACILLMSRLSTIIAFCAAIYLLVPLPWTTASLAPPASIVTSSTCVLLLWVIRLLLLLLLSRTLISCSATYLASTSASATSSTCIGIEDLLLLRTVLRLWRLIFT